MSPLRYSINYFDSCILIIVIRIMKMSSRKLYFLYAIYMQSFYMQLVVYLLVVYRSLQIIFYLKIE